jgi:hypothetical protein
MIKRLLSSLINQLEELTLSSIDCDVDLADGNIWREYISTFTQLRKFNFRFFFSFQITLDITSERIQSFKSNYWCIDKKCYVVARKHSIYTIPHFLPHTIEFLSSKYHFDLIWTNSPYQQICNENTKTIIFDQETFEKSQKESKIYYKNVEHIIWLNSSGKEKRFEMINYLTLIRTSFDLSKVTIFEGIPTNTSNIFMDFIELLPRLEEIRFQYSPKLFKKLSLLSKIRRLRLSFEKDQKCFSKDLDELCRVFYYIEHLKLMTNLDNQIIFYLIQRLNYLSSIVINCESNDNIFENLEYWNKEETLLSVMTNYSDVYDRKLVAFWIDTSRRHLIEQVKYQKPPNYIKKNKCILI